MTRETVTMSGEEFIEYFNNDETHITGGIAYEYLGSWSELANRLEKYPGEKEVEFSRRHGKDGEHHLIAVEYKELPPHDTANILNSTNSDLFSGMNYTSDQDTFNVRFYVD